MTDISVAKPRHFFVTPAPGKNLDAALAAAIPATAPTLLYKYIKPTF
jgi:hypothetical protein